VGEGGWAAMTTLRHVTLDSTQTFPLDSTQTFHPDSTQTFPPISSPPPFIPILQTPTPYIYRDTPRSC
jgi:hypothetical protein